jgi:hypothetical protein
LEKLVVYSRFWSHRRLIEVGGEGMDVWRKTDNELRAAYNQWAKHATGTIEVTFCMPEADVSGGSLEGYQTALKRRFPQFTESVAVTIVPWGGLY